MIPPEYIDHGEHAGGVRTLNARECRPVPHYGRHLPGQSLPREPGNARELTKDDRSGERDAVLAAEYLLNTDMIGYRRPARGP